MTRTPFVPVWKTAPFIRLLLPFVAGIILQWRLQFPLLFIISAVSCFAIANVMFSALPPALRFRWRTGPGLLFNFLLVATGMLLTWLKDGRHSPQWYGNLVDDRAALTLRITDPLQEKPRSYKTEAAVIGYWKEEQSMPAKAGYWFTFLRIAQLPAFAKATCWSYINPPVHPQLR